MNAAITSFESLVEASLREPEPQRFLFVFLKTLLPGEHTPGQAERFERGEGGGLQPIFCSHLPPESLSTFAELAKESEKMGAAWNIVLVGCLSGNDGQPPTDEDVDHWLHLMQQTVHTGGDLSRFLAFTRDGEPVHFH